MNMIFTASAKSSLATATVIALLLASSNVNALPVLPIEDCQSISGRFPQVEGTLKSARDNGYITSEHRCLIRSTHEIEDIGQLLEEIPENTVLLVRQAHTEQQSSESLSPIPSSPYVFEKPGSQVIQFQQMAEKVLKASSSTSAMQDTSHPPAKAIVLLGSSETVSSGTRTLSTITEISLQVIPKSATPMCVPSKTRGRLKAGTVMLGINDNLLPESSTIPVCEMESPGQIGYMFEVGDSDEFQDIGNVLISGFSFFPKIDNNPNPVDSIWRVRCYEGKLKFARNHFHLDTRASVYFQCLQTQPEKPAGITFSFRENTVVGMGRSTSQEGLLVDLRNLDNMENVRKETDISDNWFAGNIKSAVEARFNNRVRAVISNNHFYLAPTVKTETLRHQNALELYGPESYDTQQEKPEFVIQDNVFASSQNCFKVFGGMTIASQENRFNCRSLFTENNCKESYFCAYSQPDVALRDPSDNNLWLYSGHCPVVSDNFITGRMALMTKTGQTCSVP